MGFNSGFKGLISFGRKEQKQS